MNKRIFLIGFILVMLLGIPAVSYYVAKNQTKIPSKAAKSTTLSFILPSDPITPGKTFNADMQLDPGTNQVSFVRLVISYDPQKLAPAATNPLTKNDSLFGVLLEGPTTGQCIGNICTMTIAMGISPDSGKPIQGVPAIIGTVSFKALQTTDTGPTALSFATGTQVLSLASQDAPSENVLSSPQSAQISIVNLTPTPSPTSAATTITPSPTPSPTTTASSGTLTPGATPTITNTLSCSSFTASATSGNPPAQITFSLTGTDNSTNGKIAKATVNFGDGTVQDITSNGGIGTSSVSTQISHTYQTAGTYTANATLTNDAGTVSDPSTCQQTIVIGTGGAPTSSSNVTAGPTGAQTLMKTGPGQTYVGIGVASGVAAILGASLLFGL